MNQEDDTIYVMYKLALFLTQPWLLCSLQSTSMAKQSNSHFMFGQELNSANNDNSQKVESCLSTCYRLKCFDSRCDHLTYSIIKTSKRVGTYSCCGRVYPAPGKL